MAKKLTAAQEEAKRVADEARKAAGGPEAPAPKPEKAKRDLDDPETQQKILEPEPKKLTIAGVPTDLYPLPAFEQRQLLYSFFPRLVRGAIALGNLANREAPIERYAEVISRDRALSRDVALFAASSEHKPEDELDDEALNARANEIFVTATPVEFIALATYILIINEALTGGPKAKPAKAPAPKG